MVINNFMTWSVFNFELIYFFMYARFGQRCKAIFCQISFSAILLNVLSDHQGLFLFKSHLYPLLSLVSIVVLK